MSAPQHVVLCTGAYAGICSDTIRGWFAMTPCQAYVPGAFAPSLPYGSLKPKVVPPPLSTMVKPRPSSKFSKAVWAQGDGEELNQQVLQQHSCTNHVRRNGRMSRRLSMSLRLKKMTRKSCSKRTIMRRKRSRSMTVVKLKIMRRQMSMIMIPMMIQSEWPNVILTY